MRLWGGWKQCSAPHFSIHDFTELMKNRNNSVKQPAHEAVGAPSSEGICAGRTVFNPCRIFVMTKRFLAAAALALLSSTVSASATDIGATFATACPFGDCAAGISLSYLGEFVIPTGHIENGVEFGGISGLDFDVATGHYIAISDDRSERGPARFYELNVDVDASGLKRVSVVKQVTLKDKNGELFVARTVDPESIRLGKDGIYWGSEGDGKALLAPFIRVASPDGSFVREFKLPEGFAPTADKSTGIRDNLAFEDRVID